MTWSIIARDAEHGKFGIAVATRFFAVGALVPHARAGVGAVATQALVNPFFGPLGLALLQEGVTAADAVSRSLPVDAGRDHRQLHIMDRDGRAAAHTGDACVDWCGATCEREPFGRRQHACRWRCPCRDGGGISRACRLAFGSPPGRGDESGRSRGRRQARQAVGRFAHSGRRRVARP